MIPYLIALVGGYLIGESMQENETLLFNQTEETNVPGWKHLDTIIRGWIIKRQHDEVLENLL